MSEYTRTRARRALLVFDERVLGASWTATSQAGPRPGVPEPDQPSAAVLETSGELDDVVSDVEVIAVDAGAAGGGTFRWRYTGGDAFAWDPPTALSGASLISRSTTADRWHAPVACRLPSGRTIIAATRDNTKAAVHVQVDGETWVSETIEDTDGATRCALCVRDDGRVLLLYAVDTSTSTADQTQIRVYQSADDGGSWEVASRSALLDAPGRPSSDLVRVRAAYLRGRVALFLHFQDGGEDQLYQYASTDDGATFRFVSETVGDDAHPDVAVYGATIYVATLRYDSDAALVQPWIRALPGPGVPLSTVEAVLATGSGDGADWGDWDGTGIASGELAVVVDDDGRVYVYGADFDSDRQTICRVAQSAAGPYTYPWPGTDTDGCIYQSGDASTYLVDIAACLERGRVLLVHTYAGAPSTADDSLCAIWLGGWSSVGLPQHEGWDQPTGVTTWGHVYLPLDLPEDTGARYSAAFGGAASWAIGGDGLHSSVGVGEHADMIGGFTPTAYTYGELVSVGVTLDTGAELRIDVSWSNATGDGYSARVTLNATSLTVDDRVGTGTATLAGDWTGGVEVRVALVPGTVFSADDGVVVAMVRPIGDSARAWETVSLETLEVDAIGVEHRYLVSTRDGDSDIHWVVASGGDELAAVANQDPARGRMWSSRVSPAHIVSGLRLASVGGSALSAETWQIATSYDYPVEAIDPSVSRSPSRVWRSTTDADPQDLLCSVDLGWRAGDLVAIVLGNCNWRRAALYSDAGATSKIADIDLGVGDLPFERGRNTLTPSESNLSSELGWHAHEHSLAGARIVYGGVVRPVRSNQAGAWLNSDPEEYRGVRVILDEVDDGADPSGGECELWMPGAVIITTILEDTDTLLLRIQDQTTREGYLQVGLCGVARVAVLGQDYDESRVQGTVSGTTITTTRGGGRRSVASAAPRRMVDMSWDDGVPLHLLYSGDAPAFFRSGAAAGAAPQAAPAETPELVRGVFAQLKGAHLPLVYLDRLEPIDTALNASTPITILEPQRWIYGTITSQEVSLDTRRGDEGSSTRPERQAISTIRIEEEL